MWPGVFVGGFFWILWLVVSVFLVIAFFRGMQALTRIAASLERIEQRWGSRPAEH